MVRVSIKDSIILPKSSAQNQEIKRIDTKDKEAKRTKSQDKVRNLVACPKCSAGRGFYCFTTRGGSRKSNHVERTREGQKLVREAHNGL